MSSAEISTIASHRFVRMFALAIIQSIRAKNFKYQEKQVVHADMVPSISEKVQQATLKEKIVRPQVVAVAPPRPVLPRPVAPVQTEIAEGYGRIVPLLNDPSVSMIECQGADKPLKILRMGQVQMTRISLKPQEIKNILQKVSDEVKIPLLDGVFRAAVDAFSISAVISGMIGSRFVIRKGAVGGLETNKLS